MCELTDDTEDPGDQNTPEDAALDILGKKNGSDQDSNQRKKDCDTLGGKCSIGHGSLKGKDAYQSGIISDNDLGILKSDECDKQSDSYRYSMFQVHRDRVEDRFTYIGEGEQDEDDTFSKYC